MTGKADSVYTFIDNSNLFIEAKRVARILYAYEPGQVFRLRVDYGRLLKLVLAGRTIGPAASGSRAEVVNAIRDVMEDNPVPGIIALVAGDGDYVSTLERCLKKGWRVELYFWSNASGSLKRLPGVRFIELDQYLPQISFQAPEKPAGGVAEDAAQYVLEEMA